ncbi:MAG TPA: FtsX-like permease family protein, partial [Gemmatimonadaceae bacterium]|nr:FtsX-like permease family protein [Gemmatimonadaceae bacterium]
MGPVLRDRGPNEGKEAKVATWLLGVAAIVLLIACANVANLLLARALKRRREIAVRVALGVSRARLLAQLLTESLLFATLAAAAGLAIAQWGGAAMRRALLDQDSVASSVFVDTRMLIAVGGLALAAGLLSGLAPVFHATREDVAAALKAGAREGTVHRSRLRVGLLVAQAALSVVLLVGAGLFLRSLANAQHVRLGYDADHLLWVDMNARGMTLDSVQQGQIHQALLERAGKLPGVASAARALSVPFWMTYEYRLFVAGIDSVSKLGDFTLQAVTPGFFATTGTRLLRGRPITAEDRAGAPRVMVVDESMAKKLWPTEDPIGKCVRLNADTMPCTTVVGVSEDIRGSDIAKTDMHYYLSIAQFQPNDGGMFVRTVGPADERAESVRRGLQPLVPGASYVTVTPMSEIIAPEIRSWKMGATMFAIFGLLALVIAAIGLYSVIAYNVAQRTHEMGVRVALGAQARNVVGLVVGEGLAIVIPGVLLGAGLALVASRWLQPLLFQTSAKDPPVMIAVVVTLVVVAAIASWIPALRAARVDPSEALRAD